MSEDIIESVIPCLALVREALDGTELVWDDDSVHVPMAVALLGRMVFLLEAAVDLLKTDRRAASVVLLRPAIECWIDCCYVLYCKHEAVLRLSALGLQEGKKLTRVWLGPEPIEELQEAIDELAVVVAAAIESGDVREDFATLKGYPVENRLRDAIRCRGADPLYFNVYEVLYWGISASEIHTSVAVDMHGSMSEDSATFNVSPHVITPEAAVLVGLTTLLAMGAWVDVFPLLGKDIGPLQDASQQLSEAVATAQSSLRERLATDDSPEIRRAMELWGRRSS